MAATPAVDGGCCSPRRRSLPERTVASGPWRRFCSGSGVGTGVEGQIPSSPHLIVSLVTDRWAQGRRGDQRADASGRRVPSAATQT
jgi:hypothetical protein